MTDLAGCAAVVTGAANGIGRAVAQSLQEADVDVLAVDLRPEPDGPGEMFAADLTRSEANREVIEEAVERFGRLDIIVANAGFQHLAPVRDFPEEQWQRLLSLMLTSPFLLAKHGWDHLAASGRGRFVAIASAHALVASPFNAGYVAAKHGVLGLVKTLALEGGESGISATAVCPGYVRTALVEAQIADQARVHGIAQEDVLRDALLAPQAVKRLIEPSEVADVVAFLASSAGAAFTGVPVSLDQGWTAR